MALQLGRAIGRGIRRTLNPAGIVLMILTFSHMVMFVGAVNTLVASLLPQQVRDQAQFGFTFPIAGTTAGILVLVAFLFGMVIFLAATRAFTRDSHSRGRVSAALFTRRIAPALVSAIIANVIVSLAVMIGFVLLIVPGLFLAVSFTFVVFAIGVEDAGPIEALRRSWELTSGNRWRLFALVLIVGVATGLLGSVGSLVSIVNQPIGQVVSLLITAPLGVLSYGVLADAYVQLSDE